MMPSLNDLFSSQTLNYCLDFLEFCHTQAPVVVLRYLLLEFLFLNFVPTLTIIVLIASYTFIT